MKLPPETEAALISWRNRLRREGITVGSTLDELESHLRESILMRMDLGMDPQSAFDDSVRAIGSPDRLKAEFSRVGTDRRFSHAHAMYAGLAATVLIFIWWSLAFFEFPYSWMNRTHKSSLLYSLISMPFALVWTSYHAAAWSTQIDPVCRGFSRWNITTLRCSLFFTGLLAMCWWGAVQDWLVSLLVTYVLIAITVSLAVGVGSFSLCTRQRLHADWMGVLVLIGILVSAAWTSWPMRLIFHFSHAQLESLAMRVDTGEPISGPIWAGGIRVARVEKRNVDWGGGTCLWVVPREGGPTGFIRREDDSMGEPGNGINRRIRLSDRWYFVSED